jgi:hypothetical protein
LEREHNEEHHTLYFLSNIIRKMKSRMMRWEGYVARKAQNRNTDRILVGNPECKRPLGRHRCWWQNNIKMDFREIGWGGVDWIGVAQDRNIGELL